MVGEVGLYHCLHQVISGSFLCFTDLFCFKVCVCGSVRSYVHMHAGILGNQKKTWCPLELELQAAVD